MTTSHTPVDALFDLMSRQHGAASTRQARDLGLSRRPIQRLVERGVLRRPAPGVVAVAGAPSTWHQRALVATLAPGRAVLSHGAAARLHGLDGFERHPSIDVICRKGWWPDRSDDLVAHVTRGPRDGEVVEVDGIRTLDVAATLTLLPPVAGVSLTARALDSALRHGHEIDELREVAGRWRRRGRSGPATLLLLLDEREGKTLPRSWFQRLASRLFERHGVRLVDEYPVRDERGILLAELDLAEPRRRIGIECQSWRWHATPEAQHRDARRRGRLRRLGWEIVDVWWRDLDHPNRVLAELEHLLITRQPTDLTA